MDEIITKFNADSSVPSFALTIQDATGASKFWSYRTAHLIIKGRVPSPTTTERLISSWMENAKPRQYSQEIITNAVKVLGEIIQDYVMSTSEKS